LVKVGPTIRPRFGRDCPGLIITHHGAGVRLYLQSTLKRCMTHGYIAIGHCRTKVLQSERKRRFGTTISHLKWTDIYTLLEKRLKIVVNQGKKCLHETG